MWRSFPFIFNLAIAKKVDLLCLNLMTKAESLARQALSDQLVGKCQTTNNPVWDILLSDQ